MSTDQGDKTVQSTIFTEPTVTNPDQGGVKTLVNTQPNFEEVFKEQLSSIRNDDGVQKYSDVATALSALKHTQQHIKTLEEENERFRQEGVKAKTMDEVLQQLNTTKQPASESTNNDGIDVEKMRSMTFEAIQEYQAQQVAKENQTKVISALVEKFKDKGKAEEAFVRKAEELGLSIEVLNSLSATSPKAVLEYFQISGNRSPKPTEGSINTDALGSITKPTVAKKNIMFGASSSDVLAAWRAAAPSVE